MSTIEIPIDSKLDRSPSERSKNLIQRVLAHHGVKGQRWGVRRSKIEISNAQTGQPTTIKVNTRKVQVGTGPDGHPVVTSATSRRAATKTQKAIDEARLKRTVQDPRTLSDHELREAVARVKLEQDYLKVMSSQADTSSRGRAFTKALLGEIGTRQVSRVARAGSDIAVEKALANAGQKDLAKRMQPKKK